MFGDATRDASQITGHNASTVINHFFITTIRLQQLANPLAQQAVLVDDLGALALETLKFDTTRL